VPEAYVHRIGRTARAGAEGRAISLCADDERDQLRAIEKLTRQVIPVEDRRGSVAIPRTAPRPSGPQPQRRPDQGARQGQERRSQQTGRPQRRGQRGHAAAH
jgi:ATP-dependent RNA helicase RhlE